MNVKEKIIEVSKILDELDSFDDSIPEMTQNFDYKLSDLYHLLENSSLNSKFCYRFCKEMKSVLKERREFKTNMRVYHNYKAQKDRLNNGKENRKIMLSQICNEDKKLRASKYKNRIYTSEELLEKIGE